MPCQCATCGIHAVAAPFKSLPWRTPPLPRPSRLPPHPQGMQYDADAVLAALWLPELSRLPVHLRHQPFAITPDEAAQHSFVPGISWPDPIVDPATQVGHLDPTAKAAGKAKARAKAGGAKERKEVAGDGAGGVGGRPGAGERPGGEAAVPRRRGQRARAG